MTMEQVVAVLGEPDKDRFGNLDYLKLGITVIFSDDRKGGIVFSVVCYPAGDSGMERAFTGHTKDGIGLGASRAAIVSAYGNPPATNSVLELEFMKYHSLGIDFSLKDGKLLMITVVFRP
jgi:hypothetical protein